MERFDIAVVGAGPGGYVAALRAAEHGMKIAVIERDRLGGVCANQGCIPTKALLASAQAYATVRDAAAFGVHADNVRLDLAAVVARARGVAQKMEAGVASLLRARAVNHIAGTASLAAPGRLRVDLTGGGTNEIAATSIILATGARPRELPGLESDGARVWTYRDALTPQAMPASLLVVGAGAIGIEFASFYRTLGAEVTIVEALDRILPQEDADISAAARRAFEKQGIRILTGARVASLDTSEAGHLTATIRSGVAEQQVRAERVLIAAGIVANVEGLGLEATLVRLADGRVVVDEWLATGERGVFAIGDLTGPPWLAHKASREALVCVDRIAGVEGVRPLASDLVPACTYSLPQVASVGLTEAVARAAGREVRIGRASFAANGRARATGDTDGFVKTIFDAATGELLGAHMIGAEVTELIASMALARTLEATEAELLATILPHPTLSEVMGESVGAAFTGRAGH